MAWLAERVERRRFARLNAIPLWCVIRMTRPSDDDSEGVSAPRALTVVDLVYTTIRVMRAQFGSFLLIGGLCAAPGALLGTAERTLQETFGWAGPAALVVALVGYYLQQAALIHLTHAHLTDRERPTVIDALGVAQTRIVFVLVAAFLADLATLLGFALLIVPGVVLALVFFVALPAVVIEQRGPIDALKRSVTLTKGNRTAILLAVLAIAVSYVLCACVWTGSLTLVTDVNEAIPPAARFGVWLARFFGRVLFGVTISTLTGVAYARLRAIHGRIDASTVAEEFS